MRRNRERAIAVVIFAAALLVPHLPFASVSHAAPRASQDPSAYIVGSPDPHARVLAPGDFCGDCPDPAQGIFGVEFRRGDMWTLSTDGTLTHLSSCQTIDIHNIQGFRGIATGLAYDSKRDQFVVTDAFDNEVQEVSPDGTLLKIIPAPGIAPIGAAYDSTRDVYWITDWLADSLYALNPVTGATVHGFALPESTCVRCSGAAYDAAHDAIYYSERIMDARCYYVSAQSGALIGSFAMPFTGISGWLDNAFAPDGSLWWQNGDFDRVYCVEHLTTPTHKSTWGALKLRYR